MRRRTPLVPNSVPVLAAGKHRRPQSGACFMEYASYLAGERFSDHPACTHPLLASLARNVNDHLSDDARQRIVPLIHRVVGLTGDHPLIAPALSIHAATTAIPVAAYEHQKALVVGLLRALRELEDQRGEEAARLRALATNGLEFCPSATAWAQQFVARPWGRGQHFNRAAPHVINLAVVSTAESLDADELLCGLLETAVAETEFLMGATTRDVATAPTVREHA